MSGCHPKPRAAIPEASAATSVPAQEAFRVIEQRWLTADAKHRENVGPLLRSFLALYPGDPRSRLAQVYLAWVLLSQGKVAEAEPLLQPIRAGAPGTTRDLALIVEGARLTREKRGGEAHDLLLPLAGKILDDDERLLYGHELALAALQARRWRQAVEAIVRWVAESSSLHLVDVQDAAERLIGQVPPSAREHSLASLDEEAKKDPSSNWATARDWTRKLLRSQLTEVALKDRDAPLAQRLLKSNLVPAWRDPEDQGLTELAQAGREKPRIAGRSLGLVVSLGSPDDRRRSAELIAGVSRGLGLPDAAGKPGAIQLITRDDEGTDEGLARALARLSGDGAAILVAALEGKTAQIAANFARTSATPVVVLHPVPQEPAPNEFAFVLGEDPEAALSLVTQELTSNHYARGQRVGPGGMDCQTAPSAAGQSRFPWIQWKREGLEYLLLSGDRQCTRDVLEEAAKAGAQLAFGLGLDAGTEPSSSKLGRPGVAVFAAGAGPFPSISEADAPDPLAEWTRLTGEPPTWYQALGHDVASLCASALAKFPVDLVEDAREVRQLHRLARDSLAQASASLWTTQQHGFAGSQKITRQLTVKRLIMEKDGR